MALIEESFMFVGIVVGMGCTTGIVMEWMKYRHKGGIQTPEVLKRLDEIADRMARLDTAVDAMSVEVERISEGQRFTTKLLAERSQAPAPVDRPRMPGTTTPH
jgi:hypothetical protein